MSRTDKEAQADVEGVVIYDSCGCIFCDLDLPPSIIDGKSVHLSPDGTEAIPCIRYPEPEDASRRLTPTEREILQRCTRQPESFGYRSPEEHAAADSGPIGFGSIDDLPCDCEWPE